LGWAFHLSIEKVPKLAVKDEFNRPIYRMNSINKGAEAIYGGIKPSFFHLAL
jgi:hypothetical protein